MVPVRPPLCDDEEIKVEKITNSAEQVIPSDYFYHKGGLVGRFDSDSFEEHFGFNIKVLRRVADSLFFLILIKLLPGNGLPKTIWNIYRFFGFRSRNAMIFDDFLRSQQKRSYKNLPVEKKTQMEQMWAVHRGDHGCKRDQTVTLMNSAFSQHYYDGVYMPAGGIQKAVNSILKKIQK